MSPSAPTKASKPLANPLDPNSPEFAARRALARKELDAIDPAMTGEGSDPSRRGWFVGSLQMQAVVASPRSKPRYAAASQAGPYATPLSSLSAAYSQSDPDSRSDAKALACRWVIQLPT